MRDHLPSVEVFTPLPVRDNDLEINRLLSSDCPPAEAGRKPERLPTKTGTSCGFCKLSCSVTNGYHGPRGEFYCDECIWVLAENGEFQ